MPGTGPKTTEETRVNTEANKEPAEAQLCEFTAELTSTPSYISASPAMLGSHLRKAGLSFPVLYIISVLAGERATVPQLGHLGHIR